MIVVFGEDTTYRTEEKIGLSGSSIRMRSLEFGLGPTGGHKMKLLENRGFLCFSLTELRSFLINGSSGCNRGDK